MFGSTEVEGAQSDLNLMALTREAALDLDSRAIADCATSSDCLAEASLFSREAFS